jgi:Mg2+ transporter MgtE
VVRVNDLELVRVTGTILVGNADIGGMGILRRIGVLKPLERAARLFNVKVPDNCISWDNMELLHDRSMRLRVSADKIADLHPADIAEIIGDLNRLESQEFLNTLDVKQLADTLEEIEPELQASLVRQMSDEKVADVLEEMGPDEAADLLAELSPERSEDLLDLMEKDEAADVRKLLKYPEDTAGGIMTTEFASVRRELTADQTIQALREKQEEAETLFYVYVVDADGRLEGVFSLSRLIFARPESRVEEFMQKRIISIHPLDSQDEIAQMISKYDLLALPVVDEDGILHGIVTADDALDKIIPTAWKKRLPRFYR